jgi:hypothetical protein
MGPMVPTGRLLPGGATAGSEITMFPRESRTGEELPGATICPLAPVSAAIWAAAGLIAVTMLAIINGVMPHHLEFI